jgi:hypothetical protein
LAGWPKSDGAILRHCFSVPRNRHDQGITLMRVGARLKRCFPTRAILLGNTVGRDLAKEVTRL